MENALIPKYCDNNSILLINHVGLLRKLFCPFMVRCRVEYDNLKPGMQVWVEEVAVNAKDELLYSVLGKFYSYNLFEIKIFF
ncbi:hypothetical protein SAMN05660816_06922 [Niastella yeongjuensis]|nr:hypothetical protein SAMN05660816_06922 [Niastella yeongjuensis]